MDIDCSDVPNNVTYDCANPWGQGCTSEKHFDFTSLWKYTQNIQAACPNDSRLFSLNGGGDASSRNASLTQAACEAIAGSQWSYYPGADIWTRLTTWKFPLLQLVFSFPRPPLSFSVECLVILHLLGDPVDTIEKLLAKMSSCQAKAKECREQCEDLLEKPTGEDEDRNWKALAIITDAYGEWKEDDRAKLALQRGLRDNPERRKELAGAIRQTGRALAADRSTKFLPIIVAQAFFIATIGIAIFRTASAAGASASSDTVFISVEAHSIAFSAQYFWIIPAVFLSSVIGVSQTEAAIPRILRRFQIDIERLELDQRVMLPNECLERNEDRIFRGGVYSWQPQRSKSFPNLFPYLIVILATVTGMAVSATVPPDGWDCRHNGEICILAAWILSARADVWLVHIFGPVEEKRNQKIIFWSTLVKDLAVTIATMGGVITTQIGVFNRCSCWTLWGKTGLALPQMPDNAQILFDRINTVYPAITFSGIGLQLVIIPLFISISFQDALRTFVQRDDRKSNAIWLWKLLRKSCAVAKAIRAALPLPTLKSITSARGSRTSTVRVEEGPSTAAAGATYSQEELEFEMQPLTQTWSEEPQDMIVDEHDTNTPTVDQTSAGGGVESVESGDARAQSSGTARSGIGRMQGRPEPRRRNTERSSQTI